MGVSARLAANGVFRPFGPLYIPFGEQGHSCIKGCLVRVAAQVSPLRIVSQLEIKGNSTIYLHSILNIFSHNCFLSSIVTTNGFFFFFCGWAGALGVTSSKTPTAALRLVRDFIDDARAK